MLNNALWQDIVASVPFKRRLLLVPQCLKHDKDCPAEIDEFGLLCESCGRCVIKDIQETADDLEMMCIIAEGSTMTARIIEQGQADAIIGVGCFSALEKAFEQMNANAVPGLALPLFNDGCTGTSTDVELLLEMIARIHEKKQFLLPLKPLLKKIRKWFSSKNLEEIMGPAQNEVEQIARDYLLQTGKRFRPFLCAAIAQSLGCQSLEDKDLTRLMLSVECFHKASLIHDDIEDEDSRRNGLPALHTTHGLATALNAGDLLIGEGYRMISELQTDAKCQNTLLKEAVKAHTDLCIGQGSELLATHTQRELSLDETLEIFKKKTAPAFNVAFQFAANLMNADLQLKEVLAEFSDFLGIAYQIKDDLADFEIARSKNTLQPSSIVEIMARHLKLSKTEGQQKAETLLFEYRQKALCALAPINNVSLKCVLYKITHNLLKD
jgi:geranylgeranyl pyrophosphate synthase